MVIILVLTNSALLIIILSWSYWIFKKSQKVSRQDLSARKRAERDYLKMAKNIGEEEVNRLKVSIEPTIVSYLEVLQKQANDQFEKAISQFKTGLEQHLLVAKTVSDKEIEEYKKLRIQSLEQDLDNRITQIAKQILPKAISLEDHYDLVMGALEKMKGELKV